MHRFKVFSQNAGSFRPQVGLGMHLGSDFVNWEKFLFPSPCGVGDASESQEEVRWEDLQVSVPVWGWGCIHQTSG